MPNKRLATEPIHASVKAKPLSRTRHAAQSHAAYLENAGMAALSEGDVETAFQYIDRRCRANKPAAYHHVLRAEILARMGAFDEALASVARAIEIAPGDLQANRRVLAWAKGKAQLTAARQLVRVDADPDSLISALKILRRTRPSAVGSIRILDASVRGWAVWDGEPAPHVALAGDGRVIPLIDDLNHPLRASGFQHAADFELPRPETGVQSRARLKRGRRVLQTAHIMPSRETLPKGSADARSASVGADAEAPALTVIVPVYRDYEATQTCLESLRTEAARKPGCKVILIDDASPERSIKAYLKTFVYQPRFEVLTNATNMGFVGAVNRALSHVTVGSDVILLNADTILTPRVLQRLRDVAASDTRIGTITPLSNNGEFTSFPIPVRANALPSAAERAALARDAARANLGLVVDIPSGIGFCLFISAACLAAVGALNTSFEGGYLEDLDFCLRARESGFRNVCAPAIFVAHAGTRSFLGDKRGLVARNMQIIEDKFPRDQQETAAFLASDPLRAARAAIERRMVPRLRFDRMIVAGAGTVLAVVEERTKGLRARGLSVLLMIAGQDTMGRVVRFRNGAETAPQSLEFRTDTPAERADLQTFIRDLRVDRIEIAEAANLPEAIIACLYASDRPLDLFVADASLMQQSDGTRQAATGRATRWAWCWERAERVVTPCPHALDFVAHMRPEATARLLLELQPCAEEPTQAAPPTQPLACGFVVAGASSDDFCLMRDLARRMRDRRFVVIGTTLDDLGLMALGNVFVTGAGPADLAHLCALERLTHLFAVGRKPLFGHPATLAARRTTLPLAYFDWSFGVRAPNSEDLALQPTLDAAGVAVALGDWMSLGRQI